jgi:AraC family transcriptional regulator
VLTSLVATAKASKISKFCTAVGRLTDYPTTTMKPSTERDYHRRIARVIEAILADPGAPHTVESLASVAHLSPFHFHRIYRALTGESIVETVQRVRLARAAHRLTVAGDSVTTIAGKAGYESPQAFSRAFRGFAGVSPSTFQMRQRRLSTLHASGPRIADASPAIPDEDLQCVELVELAPIEVLCLRHDGPTATINQTFKSLGQMLGCTPSEALAQGTIGMCSGDPEEPGSFRYLAAILRDASMSAPSPVETVRIEGGLYASHRLVGPYALIAPAFQALYGGWLPQSGYEADDRMALEFYRSRPSPERQTENVTDLMIPVRKD